MSLYSGRTRKHLSQINIPGLQAEPASPVFQDRCYDDQDSSDLLKDPAKQVLVKTEEAKRKRKQQETKIALEKIQDRIDYTIKEYENSDVKSKGDDVSLEVLEDPAQLYELLSDARARSKYQQHLTVFIVGYEEKCEQRERILTSLQDFFIETEVGGTKLLLEEIEEDEIDFESATSGLESALDTAQTAAKKLLDIKREMGQLIAIFAAYPDTKKGRKKMEKALLKAQEEVAELSTSLEEVQRELEESSDKCGVLQKQIEMKTVECATLRKTAEQVKMLQVSNDSLKNELSMTQRELERTVAELTEARSMVPTESEVVVRDQAVAGNLERIAELERLLEEERSRSEGLVSELASKEESHRSDLAALASEHEGEVAEMRGRYEEQLKSLMEDDDMFGDDDVIGEGEDLIGGFESDVMTMEGIEGEDEDEFDDDIEPSGDDVIDMGNPHSGDNELSIEGASSQVAIDHNTQQEGKDDGTASSTDVIDLDTPPNGCLDDQTAPQYPPTPAPQHPKVNRQHRASISSTPGTSTPASSVAGGGGAKMKGRLDKMRREYEVREKKLRGNIEEIKTKSRKAITSLKAQLADMANRRGDELETVQGEVEELNTHLRTALEENGVLEERIAALELDRERLTAEAAESEREMKEKMILVSQLQQELETFAAAAQGQRSSEDYQPMTWHDQSEQLTPRSLGASPYEATPPHTIPMDEVFTLGEDGQMSEASGSVDITGAGRGVHFLPTSLDQSVNSMDFAPMGSPLEAASLISGEGRNAPPPPALQQMLAHQSRMSYHSPVPQLHIGYDHPIVVEWGKAYDSVIRFKDSLVEMLQEGPPSLAQLANDLMEIELHSLDRSQDVQGQITEMRFSLALLMHQLEQTLQESLTTLVEGGGGEGEGGGEEQQTHTGRGDGNVFGGGVGGSHGNELKVTVAHLKRKLQHREDTHKIELQESKETIANLSSKVESLKVEVANLRRILPQEGSGLDQGGSGASIMFTRLDYERNTRTLKTALEKDRISPTTYHKVTSGMEEYLTIPSKRLALLSQRCHHKALASNIMDDIETHVSDPVTAAKAMGGVSHRAQHRELELTLEMDRLRVQRQSLAHTLTHTLTHIEQRAGVFLIKPVYTRSIATHPSPHHTSLITPITRPLPVRKPVSPVRQVASVAGSGRGTPHPTMRLVSALVKSRQSQRNTEGVLGTAVTDHAGSPRHCRHTITPSHTAGTPSHLSRTKWCVDASRHIGGGDEDRDRVMTPLLPRMVELDILKHRQTDTLLGHILPGLYHHPHTPTPHSSPPHRLTPLKEQNSDQMIISREPSTAEGGGALQMQVSWEFPSHHSALPPIQVPSHRDGLLATAVH